MKKHKLNPYEFFKMEEMKEHQKSSMKHQESLMKSVGKS